MTVLLLYVVVLSGVAEGKCCVSRYSRVSGPGDVIVPSGFETRHVRSFVRSFLHTHEVNFFPTYSQLSSEVCVCVFVLCCF